jgi:DNA-binding PadR family transcriptional regulator
MIMTEQKTYSVKEAANEVRLSRAIVSRLCQRGLIGTKYEFPEFSQHVYRLTDEDLETLRDRKKDWQKKLEKKSA